LRRVPKDSTSELHAPAAYFGKLAQLSGRSKAYVHPHLLLRNTTKHPITANATVYGKDEHGGYTELSLKPLKIESESVLHVDLEEVRHESKTTLADGAAGLRIAYDATPTDLMADLLNVDETADFTLYDDVRDLFLQHARLTTAISFNLGGNSQSFLILKNVTDQPQQARVRLDYDDGKAHYDVNLGEVPAQQVEVVDIKHLRDMGLPDRDGQRFLSQAEFGGAVILSEPGAFVASDPTFKYSAAPLAPDAFGPDDPDDDFGQRPFFPPSCGRAIDSRGGGTVNMDRACRDAANRCLVPTTVQARCAVLKCQRDYCGNHACTDDERQKSDSAREEYATVPCDAFPCRPRP